MSLRDAATRTAVLTNLASRIDTELKAAKKELQAELKAAKEQTGTQKVSISLPDGVDVGTASLVQPKAAAVVTDEDAFLKWVLAVRPDEVVRRFVTEVRPSWQTVVLKELTAAGVTQWCDKDTGEVHDVPGVEIQGRAAYTRVTVPDEGAAAIADAWQSGALALPGVDVPQITAGGAK
jgi:hypothetical protein